jgi:hypothetical protein
MRIRHNEILMGWGQADHHRLGFSWPGPPTRPG